ncbi:MAG: ABC transporter ATP-binding protein [Rhodothalassiaceae bacterium]
MIALSHVSKIFRIGDETIHAVNDVSLDIAAGEYLALVGSSGSGKSTLLGLIGGLDRPSRGSICVEGQDLAALDDEALAAFRNRRLGFVFQQFNLLPGMSALENVETPLIYAGVAFAERRRLARAALDRVSLLDRQHHRPAQLSGGQQQRVAVARALVTRPSLIIADEPTGALDSESAANLMAIFDELHFEGMTVLIVTHDGGIAERARRCIRMKDGRILSDEAP